MTPGLPADLSNLTPEQRQQVEEKLKNMSPEELAELQLQQCIFCQIISGKIPSKKIYEDNFCLAVLDINPAAKGHLLLLTKEHYAIMPQVHENVLDQLFLVSKQLSKILLKVLKVDGVNVFVANGPAAGQRAQHFMIHLIPRKTGDKILDLEENLIDQEMISKVKSAVEGKLKALLKDGGLKEGTPALPPPNHPPLEDKEKEKQKELSLDSQEETFVTSDSAKRYHKENCAFAQNIPSKKKITLNKEQVEQDEKLPCTCVTGKKIPLKKNGAVKKTKKSTKKVEKKPIKKKEKKGIKKTKKIKDESKTDEDASLDDIAQLFR